MKMAAVPTPNNDVEKVKYQYSKVSLSLENCILPSHKLSPSISQLDGLDKEAEIELRILGCELIQTSGILLRLPQVAMATGQVLFQRFFYSKSFVRQAMEVVAMACITLASKIEEAPRRMRDVINVFHHIKQVKAGKTIQPLILDQNYINLKCQVIKAERRVLKELGFCVHIKHPHKIIVTLLEVLKVKDKTLMQTAWNYMNDSLRTEVFIRYDPETVACSCIHLSARLLQIPLPNKPAWYQVFGVNEATINEISHIIISLYSKKKPDHEKLDKIVEELKKAHNEAKMKAKEIHNANTQSQSSTPLQPSSPRNGVKSPNGDVKKERSNKHGDSSPRHSKESSRKRNRGGSASPHSPRKRAKSSSSADSSLSPSPLRRKGGKTPPRNFKERSKSKGSSNKKHRRSSHKHRQHSTSPTSRKTSAKNKHRSRSRSPHERNSNHHTNSVHEKSSHKSSRRERVKDGHREKKRR